MNKLVDILDKMRALGFRWIARSNKNGYEVSFLEFDRPKDDRIIQRAKSQDLLCATKEAAEKTLDFIEMVRTEHGDDWHNRGG